MRKAMFALRLAAWLAVSAGLVSFTLKVLRDITGTDIIAGPVAALLALAILASGIPRLSMPKERKVWRLRFPSKADRALGNYGLLRRETRPVPRFRITRMLALTVAVGIVVGDLVAIKVRDAIVNSLPADRSALLKYDPPVTTRVYAAGTDGKRGEQICEFTLENRVRMPLKDIPEIVQQAFIAAEDKHFRTHHGIDPEGIGRAAMANYESGEASQGASTITQQVVKQLVLKDSRKTIRRKIQEAVLAVEIERVITKDQILEAYLNHVFLGRGAYGVEAAARTYFGKGVAGLTIGEAAILAGLPRAPSADSPVAHFDNARSRQRYVLGRMLEDGYIDKSAWLTATQAPVMLVIQDDPLNRSAAAYFCDLTRRELKRLYGNQAIFSEGLTVDTTLDMKMQRAAEVAVRSGLLDLERRIGWNGPDGHDDAYVGCRGSAADVPDGRVETARVASVTGNVVAVCMRGRFFTVHPDDAARMRTWETKSSQRLKIGDMIAMMVRTEPTTGNRARLTGTGRVLRRHEKQSDSLTRYAVTATRVAGPEHPEALQAALMAVEPSSGELKAYVGGYDFGENQFNVPIMAHRQPGSSIKMDVYLAGLMDGMTVEDKVMDSRVCYDTSSGPWCPENYTGPDSGKRYHGLVRLDKALANSLNTVSVKIETRAGVGVDGVIDVMRMLGYASPQKRVLALAVGATEVTLWEHTYAYAQVAANGARAPSHPWPETQLMLPELALVVDPEAGELPAAEAAPTEKVNPESVANQRRVGVFFRKVTDRHGNVLLENLRTTPEERGQAVPSGDAYAMVHLMKGVVEVGTGKRALELGRPIAAKTGTTNDFRDVWFMGCTPDLCAGTWVGRMTPVPIVKEATGGAVALPIWLAFMKAGHPDVKPRDFPIPDDVALLPSSTGGLSPFQRGRVPGS